MQDLVVLRRGVLVGCYVSSQSCVWCSWYWVTRKGSCCNLGLSKARNRYFPSYVCVVTVMLYFSSFAEEATFLFVWNFFFFVWEKKAEIPFLLFRFTKLICHSKCADLSATHANQADACARTSNANPFNHWFPEHRPGQCTRLRGIISNRNRLAPTTQKL